MDKTLKIFLLASLIVVPFSCGNSEEHAKEAFVPNTTYDSQFYRHWYDGKAEISSYKLTQARYGELREGSAVMVFVTEPFSLSKHIKMDDPDSNPTDRTEVLKLNFTRNFNTGIYPYSILTSSFSALTNGKSLKINNSCQEWCGHTYAELNLDGTDYQWLLHSYFESEGNQSWKIPVSPLEDELWNQIRISPEQLVTGKTKMVPSMTFLRFKHIETRAYDAVCSLEQVLDKMLYTIEYPNLKRSLTIEFSKEFPYEIQGWQESYPDGWDDLAAVLVTTGKLDQRIRSDYWNQHSNEDAPLRKKLGL